MPTYTYECQACGNAFDELQGMTDAKLKKCPKCHKSKLVRLIGGGSGMIFKGSGFYETDYKRKPAPTGDKKESPEQLRVSVNTTKPATGTAPAPATSCGGGCACHPH